MDFSNILSTILENFWNILPFRKVHEYEQGLRWTWGKAGRVLGAGIHLYMPYIQSIDVENTKLRVSKLTPQAIGDHSYTIAVAFKMTDIKERYLNMQDEEEEELVGSMTQGFAGDLLCGKSPDEVWAKKEELETAIAASTHQWVQQYGYEVDEVKILEYTKSMGVRIL